jgi:chromosome segregation ATPase
MEIEQLIKRLDWLDEERRKDKDIIARQEKRISSMEGNITAAHQQIKDLSGEIARLSTVTGRMDEYDGALLQYRIEVNRQFEELEKQTKKREEEMEKVRRVEMRALDSNIVDVRKELEPIAGLRRGIQTRVEEEQRLSRSIDELAVKIQEIQRSEEEFSRIYKLVEDGRRQDSKRLVDLQGEVTALRKRADEQRGQMELVSANIRKAEGRLNETSALETERREAQTAFLERQALLQVEHDRTWKDWSTRIDAMDSKAADVETHLLALEKIQGTVKRLTETAEDLIQRVERRVNEITEVQRLSEERFRQEWVTFKADDQKRWTNYTLTQEEQRSELTRNLEKIDNQLTLLGESLQEMQDVFHQMTEETERRLQSMLSLAHDWVAAYERVGGRSR